MTRKFSIEDLEMLATWLDRVADVQEAKAKEMIAHGSATKDAIKAITGKRDKASNYAWTAREAALRLRTREKRAGFVAPTLGEVLEYARKIEWSTADAEAWFDYFQSNGWRVGGKTKMLDWRAAAKNGKRRSVERGATARQARKPNEDHPRWAAWLKARTLTYEPYGTALPYMREEFEKWLKENP